ncbi:MAG TPA: M67 family metallopeptidase [Nitrosopumilaceae archaeon]|nr:M67 family metallopeptidase [Nitrosopumilaceae archaeon]
MQLVLTNIQRELLVRDSVDKQPNEACALLIGNKQNDKLVVREIFFTKNIEESPINFTISNEELIIGYRMAEEKKLEVIGIFHSHPNSEPFPSETDRKFMEINPVPWVIFSNRTKNFKAYIFDSKIIEVQIIS